MKLSRPLASARHPHRAAGRGDRHRRCLITAHGASDRARAALRARGLRVIEATWPAGRRAHLAVATLVREGYHLGPGRQRDHVEVRGLTGDLDAFDVVLTEADLEQVLERRGSAWWPRPPSRASTCSTLSRCFASDSHPRRSSSSTPSAGPRRIGKRRDRAGSVLRRRGRHRWCPQQQHPAPRRHVRPFLPTGLSRPDADDLRMDWSPARPPWDHCRHLDSGRCH